MSDETKTRSIVNTVDKAIAWAFPKRLFPGPMLEDSYWLGILTGMFLGGIAIASALSPTGGSDFFVAMLVTPATLRFITWRLEAIQEADE